MGWNNRKNGTGLRRHVAAWMATGGAAVMSVSGCSTSGVPRYDERASVSGGDQAASWEAVFLTPAAEAIVSSGEAGPADEYARNDGRLGVGEPGPLLATSQWPEPIRASIEHPRYVYIRDDARRMLFFVPDDHRFHHHPHQPYAPHRWWHSSQYGR